MVKMVFINGKLKNFLEHCHKPRTEGLDYKARRKLLIASGLCVVFIIVEVIGIIKKEAE